MVRSRHTHGILATANYQRDGKTASRTYASAGTYTVTLTVTDNRGATASTTRTVQVDAPNQPPVAAFEFAPTGGTAPLPVVFDGSLSTDPEGPIAAYTWDFGDGTGTSTGSTLSHTFATAGTFIVRLTVADSLGRTASTTQSITISGGRRPSSVTISGRATYERVPFSSNVNLGLSYANASAQPIREAVVELIRSGGSTLATTTTDDNGNYSLTAPASTSVFVRVQAQSRRTATPARAFSVCSTTPMATRCMCSMVPFQLRDDEPDEEPVSGFGLGRYKLHQHSQRGPVCDPRHNAFGGALRR